MTHYYHMHTSRGDGPVSAMAPTPLSYKTRGGGGGGVGGGSHTRTGPSRPPVR